MALPRRPASRARSVGRPRADRRKLTRPPQQEILFHAARLFARQGITATSTREIAAAAGLRQPSLFHWFENKDAIVEALLELSIAPTLAHAERCFARDESAALRLYRVLAFDARELCASPYDLTALWLAPEARAKRFVRFWRQRDQLFELLHALVAMGVRANEFRVARAAARRAAPVRDGRRRAVVVRSQERVEPGAGRRRARGVRAARAAARA